MHMVGPGEPPRPATTDYDALVALAQHRFEARLAMIGPGRIRNAALLEIGSGRDACLAALFMRAGAACVHNVEIDPYGFIWDDALYQRFGLGGGDHPLHDIRICLGRSATNLPCAAESIDVSMSIAVLEHIRPDDMDDVARELFRVTRLDGVGYHRIDLVDHYTRRRDPFRMHRFPQWMWEAMYSNRASYSNRFRMDDFSRIFRAAGFMVRFDDVRSIPDGATECMLVLGKSRR